MSEAVPENLEALVAPHIDSFDYCTARGLKEAVFRVEGVEITHPENQSRLRLWLDEFQLSKPTLDGQDAIGDTRLFPSQCRESETTYKGQATVELCADVDGKGVQRMVVGLGKVPIMVKSKLCHLRNLSKEALVQRREEAHEMGGYFIVNGIERIIRLLIVPRRNYIMALQRGSYSNRGPLFSDKACTIRCTRPDQSSQTVRLYYLKNGNASLTFLLRKQEFFIPVAVIIKSLMEATDREIYERLVAGMTQAAPGGISFGSHFIPQRVELMLRELHTLGLSTRAQCLAYLGSSFRAVLDLPARRSDAWVGQKVLDDYVFVHLHRPVDKYNLIISMLHKLYALVDGLASEDNADCLQHHELLLPGHLLTIYIKEKLQEGLTKMKMLIQKDLKDKPGKINLSDSSYLRKMFDKAQVEIGARIESLLSTGNIASSTGLDLMQKSGFTLVAEKLNYFRYISHFRSVHRGAFFTQLRTTAVRKLLPESWGFMCPVHTPDGTPCGLLNHLALPCLVTTDTDELGRQKDTWAVERAVVAKLVSLGMVPAVPSVVTLPPPAYLTIMLDGRLIGSIPARNGPPAVAHLRLLKVTPDSEIPADLEVGYVPPSEGGQYPGIYLFSTPARMMRPVRQLPACAGTTAIELVGSFEQAYMEIRCPDGGEARPPSEGRPGTTHEELSPTNMLSVIANLTPWSDYNQSPRNMYQCQMGKQTMGFPLHSFPYRNDNKLYRLHTPQTPIARTKTYLKYNMDEYPTGTNAVVAVLSYTGYDMEDAMIINKSSMERGLGHGTIYKTQTIDLAEHRRGVGTTHMFAQDRRPGNHAIDVDGLPHIGERLKEDDGFCSAVNKVTKQLTTHKLHGAEGAIVDQVTLIGAPRDPLQKVSIKMRYERKPVIGDKFSSRHGQKGVLSQLWPDVDMPFSDRHGIRPDIIINPHAFPSRMTIGMLIESMASKVGALKGEFVDATPFRAADSAPSTSEEGEDFQEGVEREGGSMAEEFGKQLAAKGYSYHGTESMYSGLYGTEMDCHIYIGLVYYQRLRHMVSDKYQVRSVGPVNKLHRQPVKGRKMGGGIRFGEMERDSLLAHGASFLLHDRLHTCSDYHTMDVCSKCGSLLAPELVPSLAIDDRSQCDLQTSGTNRRKVLCRVCQKDDTVERVAMPYVFKYLASELAAMNIKLELSLKDS